MEEELVALVVPVEEKGLRKGKDMDLLETRKRDLVSFSEDYSSLDLIDEVLQTNAAAHPTRF